MEPTANVRLANHPWILAPSANKFPRLSQCPGERHVEGQLHWDTRSWQLMVLRLATFCHDQARYRQDWYDLKNEKGGAPSVVSVEAAPPAEELLLSDFKPADSD